MSAPTSFASCYDKAPTVSAVACAVSCDMLNSFSKLNETDRDLTISVWDWDRVGKNVR